MKKYYTFYLEIKTEYHSRTHIYIHVIQEKNFNMDDNFFFFLPLEQDDAGCERNSIIILI